LHEPSLRHIEERNKKEGGKEKRSRGWGKSVKKKRRLRPCQRGSPRRRCEKKEIPPPWKTGLQTRKKEINREEGKEAWEEFPLLGIEIRTKEPFVRNGRAQEKRIQVVLDAGGRRGKAWREGKEVRTNWKELEKKLTTTWRHTR